MHSLSYLYISAILTICLSSVVSQVAVVHKCCFANEVIDISSMKCRPSGQNRWTPVFYSDTQSSTNALEISYEIKEKSPPKCPNKRVHVFPLKELSQISAAPVEFRLLASGELVAKHQLGHWVIVPSPFCIDGIQNFDDSGAYTGDESDQLFLACPVQAED